MMETGPDRTATKNMQVECRFNTTTALFLWPRLESGSVNGVPLYVQSVHRYSGEPIYRQPRSQGFSLLNWVGGKRPNSKGKSPGNEVDL